MFEISLSQDAHLTRTQTLFWTTFIFALFVPFAFSVFSPLPFSLFVPLIGVGFFIAHRIFFSNWPFIQTPLPGLSQLITVLVALMLCSALWSIKPEATFERALKVGGLLISSFALVAVAQKCPPVIWRKYKLLFPFTAFLVGGITCFDIFSGMPIYNSINHKSLEELRPDFLNKNASVFVMSLPVALYLAWKSRSIIFFIIVLMLGIATFLLTYSQACQLSILVMALAAFGCLSFLEKITIRTAFISLSFLLLMLPWIAPTLFDLLAVKIDAVQTGVMADASAALRLENWDFLSRRILENPLSGFGMDTTRYMIFDTEQLYFHNNSIMHPHNIVLQMWIEFGIFGILWTLAFFAYFYAFLMKLKPQSRRLAFLTFCGIMVFMLVSWSIWASWLMAFSFYLATLCVLAAKTSNVPANS